MRMSNSGNAKQAPAPLPPRAIPLPRWVQELHAAPLWRPRMMVRAGPCGPSHHLGQAQPVAAARRDHPALRPGASPRPRAMEHSYVLLRLLEHGALNVQQMRDITGWPAPRCPARYRELGLRGHVAHRCLDGTRYYGLPGVLTTAASRHANTATTKTTIKRPPHYENPAELNEADRLLAQYGRWAMDRFRRQHCGSMEHRYVARATWKRAANHASC